MSGSNVGGRLDKGRGRDNGRGKGRDQGLGFDTGDQRGRGRGSQCAGNKKAEEKFNEYCLTLAIEGYYVNAQTARETLQIENLQYLSAFRNIDRLNDIVDVAVKCYTRHRSICIYLELEQIIVRSINRFQKRGTKDLPNFESFDEIGMGSLTAHREIALFFGFSISITQSQIPRLKMDDVVDSALKFVAARLTDRNKLKEDKDKANDLMTKNVCLFLSKEYGCIEGAVGLVINYQKFLHGWDSVVSETQLLRELKSCYPKCLDRLIDIYTDEISTKLTILRIESGGISTSLATSGDLGSKVHKTVILLKDVDIDLKAAHTSFKTSIIERSHNEDSYENIYHSLQGKVVLLLSMPTNSSSQIDFTSAKDYTSLEFFEALQGHERYIAFPNKLDVNLSYLVTAFITLLSIEDHEISSKRKKSKAKVSQLESSVANAVLTFMSQKCMDGIPPFAIVEMKLYITQIVQKSMKQVSTEELCNLQHDLGLMSNEILGTLVMKYNKGGYVMLKSSYIAIMTISIIMHRILCYDSPPTASDPDEVENVLRSIPEWSKEVLDRKLPHELGPVIAVFEAMGEVEGRVIRTLNVPAFECLRMGPFLPYMRKLHLEQLITVLGEKMGAEKGGVHDGPDEPERPSAFKTMDEDDVTETLTACIEELVSALPRDTGSGSSGEEILSLLLSLESVVLQRLKCVSFIRATGQSLSLFISSLLARSEQEPEQEQLIGFCNSYDMLLSRLPVTGSREDGSEVASYLSDQPVLIASCTDTRLLESAALERAVAQYRSRVQDKSLREFLDSLMDISISEKEEVKLLSAPYTVWPEVSALHFFTPSTATGTGTGIPFTFPGDHRCRALQLLGAAPIGRSCLLSCLWKCLEITLDCSLVDFIIKEEAALLAVRPNIAYVTVYIGGIGDCIPIPTDSSSSSFQWAYKEELHTCFTSKDYAAVGAWCLAGTTGLICAGDLRDALGGVIGTVLKADGLDRILDLSVRSAMALPSPFRSEVLLLLLGAVATESSLDLKFVQHKLFRKYWTDKKGATTDSKATLCALISDVSHSDAFAPLLELALTIGETVESWSSSSSTHRNASLSRNPGVEYLDISNMKIISGMTDVSLVSTDDPSPSLFGIRGTRTPSSALASELSDTCDISTCTLERDEVIVAERHVFVRDLLVERFDYDSDGIKKPETAAGKMLRKALSILADDLYSEELHFVMELVQNADDNKYHSDASPSLLIDLNLGEIIVHNNEIGFSEENVSAVCNLGQSTKQVRYGAKQRNTQHHSVPRSSVKPECSSSNIFFK